MSSRLVNIMKATIHYRRAIGAVLICMLGLTSGLHPLSALAKSDGKHKDDASSGPIADAGTPPVPITSDTSSTLPDPEPTLAASASSTDSSADTAQDNSASTGTDAQTSDNSNNNDSSNSQDFARHTGGMVINEDSYVAPALVAQDENASDTPTDTPDVTQPEALQPGMVPPVTFHWTTDVPSTSYLFYSTSTAAYDLMSPKIPAIKDETKTTDHTMVISGFAEDTRYNVAIQSVNDAGDIVHSDLFVLDVQAATSTDATSTAAEAPVTVSSSTSTQI